MNVDVGTYILEEIGGFPPDIIYSLWKCFCATSFPLCDDDGDGKPLILSSTPVRKSPVSLFAA